MIPVYEPYLGSAELDNVIDVMKRGLISGTIRGDYTGEFENLVSKQCGVRHGITTTSGTTALALAVATLDIGEGDEVLVPALTNIASAFAVSYTGAKPVFLDSEPVTWNLDPDMITEKITPRTRAIMAVHLYGHPVDMDPVKKIAEKHGLFVIEDNAESQGAEYRGRKTGGIGHIGCLSFFINKTITTGEGGMVVTDDDKLAERARFLKNLGYSSRDKFIHTELAYNFRLTNLQAAIGVAQMHQIDSIVERKRRIAKMYTERLSSISGLQLPCEQPWAKNIYWMYSIVLPDDMPERDVVRDRLAQDGIETRNFFLPMHKQPVFQKMGIVLENETLPVSERLGSGDCIFRQVHRFRSPISMVSARNCWRALDRRRHKLKDTKGGLGFGLPPRLRINRNEKAPLR
jgi:perosamine synthetase